jgi:type IV secretion system protein VirB10
MASENEEAVDEKPSTHSQKAQQLVFGVIILVLLIMSVASFMRMNDGGTKILEEQATQLKVEGQAPKQNALEFESRFKQAQNENSRSKGAGVEEGETYQELVARLRRELLAKNEPQQSLVSGATGGTSNKETWADKEMERVRTARYDEYELDLGFSQKGRKARSSYQASGTRGSDLTTEIGRVNAEIARAEALQAQYKQGINEPSSLPTPFTFDQQRQVGQAQSKSPNGQPLPGQRTLPIGTVVRAAIDQKVMSDYTGSLRLQITHDVYDLERRTILIPAGSICTAQSLLITNVNEPIQARVGYVVKNLRLPDGSVIDFSRQSSLDREGIGAVEGDVDRHLIAQFLGVAAYAMVADNSNYAGTGLEDSSYSGQVGENARSQFSPLAQKYLSLVPTITLHPGTPVRIFIEEPVFIYPWSSLGNQYDR